MRVNTVKLGLLLLTLFIHSIALSNVSDEPFRVAPLVQKAETMEHDEAQSFLLSYWVIYNQQSDYLYQLAWHTQQLGQLEQALEWYERAIMFNPQHGAAWYQMAHVCHALDKPMCVQTSVDFIQRHLNPPISITESLTVLLQKPYAPYVKLARLQTALQGSISYYHGYASNPSFSSDANVFPIYINSWLPVTIEGSRIGGSQFDEVTIVQNWNRSPDTGSVYLSGNYRQFSSTGISPAWYLFGVYQPSPRYWRGYVSLARYESSMSGGLTVLDANHPLWNNDRHIIEAGIGINRFDNSLFDGQLWHIGIRSFIWQTARFHWTSQLAYERDQPIDALRPGGAIDKVKLGSSLRYQQNRLNLEYKLLWQRQQDLDPYSAFIPIVRNSRFWHQEVKVGYALSHETEVSLSYLTQTQESNYVLFGWQDEQTKLGVTWRY